MTDKFHFMMTDEIHFMSEPTFFVVSQMFVRLNA